MEIKPSPAYPREPAEALIRYLMDLDPTAIDAIEQALTEIGKSLAESK